MAENSVRTRLESWERDLASWKAEQEYKARRERPEPHIERMPGETDPCPACNVRLGRCMLRGWWAGPFVGILDAAPGAGGAR